MRYLYTNWNVTTMHIFVELRWHVKLLDILIFVMWIFSVKVHFQPEQVGRDVNNHVFF